MGSEDSRSKILDDATNAASFRRGREVISLQITIGICTLIGAVLGPAWGFGALGLIMSLAGISALSKTKH